MTIVQVGEQEIEFPDSMSQDAIKEVLRQKFPKPKGFFERTGDAMFKRGQQLYDATHGIYDGDKLSQPQALSMGHALGVEAGAIGDIVGEGLRSGYRQLSPEIRESIESTGKTILDSDVGRLGLKALEGGAEMWGQYKDKNPRSARTIESLVNIASIVAPVATTRKGAGKINDGNSLELAEDLMFKDATKLKEVAPDLTDTTKADIKYLGASVKPSSDEVVRMLKRQGLTPGKARALKRELQKNKQFTLADIGGDEVRALTRQVGKFKGGARNLIDDFFTKRSKDAERRIINAINSDISGVDKYYGSLDELVTTRSNLANEMYGDAFAQNKQIKLTPSLNKFIEDGRFQRALDEARQEAIIDIAAPVNSLRTLDSVYRRLRDKANAFAVEGKLDAASVYGGFAKDLVKRLDEEFPAYKKARNTFAGYSQLKDAQELGLKSLKQDPELLQKQFRALTKSEKDAYLVGVAKAIKNEVFSSSHSASEALKIFGKTAQRLRLKSILGENYNEFAKKMRDEIRMNDTKQRVLGGSRTDFNLVEDDQFIPMAAQIAKGGRGEVINQIIDVVSSSIKNKYYGINDKNAKTIAKALTGNKEGIKALNKIIAEDKGGSQSKIIGSALEDLSDLLGPQIKKEN